MVNRQVEWADGSDCIEIFGAQDCLATSSSGNHDSSKLLVFPIGHPADPYIGDGVFFENGLYYVGGPRFTETSSLVVALKIWIVRPVSGRSMSWEKCRCTWPSCR